MSDDRNDLTSSEGLVTLPMYVMAHKSGFYECGFCDKFLQSVDVLLLHLGGSKHQRRCINSCIPPFGEPDHVEVADEYVCRFDLYARPDHWPESIIDDDLYWTCLRCKKKLQTQLSVENHLRETCEVFRPLQWPPCIVGTRGRWRCIVCSTWLSNPRKVENHITGRRHLSEVGGAHSQSTPRCPSATIRATEPQRQQETEWPDWIQDRGDFLVCVVCDKILLNSRSVERHLEFFNHSGTVNHRVSLACELCLTRFRCDDERRLHLNTPRHLMNSVMSTTEIV